jgi:translation initiation factor 1A
MEQEIPIRVRLPRRGEVLGEVESLLGASRFIVRCKDGKTRTCRIPGKFRKKIEIRIGFVVLIIPWSIEPDTKGDIEWIYNKTEANWLRTRGHV